MEPDRNLQIPPKLHSQVPTAHCWSDSSRDWPALDWNLQCTSRTTRVKQYCSASAAASSVVLVSVCLSSTQRTLLTTKTRQMRPSKIHAFTATVYVLDLAATSDRVVLRIGFKCKYYETPRYNLNARWCQSSPPYTPRQTRDFIDVYIAGKYIV